jgi:threonine dehydratase
MIPYAWFEEAKERISPHVQVTPITHDEEIDLYLKWENHQVTGSFKPRGAFNKVLSLEKWEQEVGLLAASAGNHGQGVALAGQLVDAQVTIFTSENAPLVKIEAMRALGAKVILVPGGYGDAESAAIEAASQSTATWISPYNDGHIVAGQGTIALETIQQLDTYENFNLEKSVWLVPAGGGGLLAGVGAVLDALSPNSRVIGVQTKTSPYLHSLFHRGTQEGITELPTIADGLAGPVERGSITIPMVRQYVDDFILVNETEVAEALAFAWNRYGERIEGSAAVTLAAVMSGKVSHRPVVAIVSGGNIMDRVFGEIVQG